MNRTEGFEKFNEKYGPDHDIFERMDNMKEKMEKKTKADVKEAVAKSKMAQHKVD